jgi:hypothetical protein
MLALKAATAPSFGIIPYPDLRNMATFYYGWTQAANTGTYRANAGSHPDLTGIIDLDPSSTDPRSALMAFRFGVVGQPHSPIA